MLGLICFSKTGKYSRQLEEIFIDIPLKRFINPTEQKCLDDFGRMSKCKTTTKHLNIRIAKYNSNRKVKNLATMGNKKDKKEDESKIVSDTNAWITVSDKAVFVNIPVEVAQEIPVSEWTNEEGVTLKRITLVGSRQILENLIDGKKKGVPLGYFKE